MTRLMLLWLWRTEDGNWTEGTMCKTSEGRNEKVDFLVDVGVRAAGDGSCNHTGMAVGDIAGDQLVP